MRARSMRDNVGPVAAGFFASLAVQSAGGWWLNSTRGVIITVAVLFAMAVASSVWTVEARWHRAAALAIGSIAGMAASLFWTGPGTIWPIVLAVATLITAAAICTGVLVAAALTSRR